MIRVMMWTRNSSDGKLDVVRTLEGSKMSAQAITESFRRLPTEAKVRLLQDLWDEVAGESAGMPLSEAHRQLIDERLRQHEDNPEDVQPWKQVRDEVLREL